MHLHYVVSKLVHEQRLNPRWTDLLLKLTQRVIVSVRPSVRSGDEMDIRHYVHIKSVGTANPTAAGSIGITTATADKNDNAYVNVNVTVTASTSASASSSTGCGPAGGGVDVTDSSYIDGVVFRKNAQFKRMRSVIPNPRILLLSSGIEYERVEGRYSLLETLQQAEEAYLTLQCRKVIALHPDLVIAGKSVSGLAARMLLEHGIGIITNVKPQVMERLARCCEAPILPSTGPC